MHVTNCTFWINQSQPSRLEERLDDAILVLHEHVVTGEVCGFTIFFLSSHLVHCSLLSLLVVFLSRLVSEFFDSCDFHYFILNLKCLNFLHDKKPTTKPAVLKCYYFNKFTSICITITHFRCYWNVVFKFTWNIIFFLLIFFCKLFNKNHTIFFFKLSLQL